MNTQKIRKMLAPVVLALAILAASITTSSAQGPVIGGSVAQFTCVRGTVNYPVGSVVRYTLVPPPNPVYVWQRCELKMPSSPGSGIQAVWVTYGYNPG